jgi:hypothetical protein
MKELWTDMLINLENDFWRVARNSAIVMKRSDGMLKE